MKYRKTNEFAVLLFTLLGLCVTGCSSNTIDTYYSTNYSVDAVAPMSMNKTKSMPDKVNISEASLQSESSSAEIEISDDKLVYYTDLTIETLDYDSTIDSLNNSISAFSGIIESQSEYNNNYDWYSLEDSEDSRTVSYNIRIPAEFYDDFVSSAGTFGKVKYKSSRVENISKQYNDVSIRLEALEIEQKKLLEMMNLATEISDMISIEERLSNIQTELNQAKTEISRMDTDVAYSYVNITINEVQRYSAPPDIFSERFVDNAKDSWTGFLDAMEWILFTFVKALPFLLVIAVVYVIYVFVIKKISNKVNFHPFKRLKEKRRNKKLSYIKSVIDEYKSSQEK